MIGLGFCTCGRAVRLAGLALSIAIVAGCGASPTTSTPTTTSTTTTTSVPIADAPTITCATLVSANTLSATGARVTYPAPQTDKGEPPVSVVCNPPSGNNFPVGETSVECMATDNRDRTAACSIVVRVTKLPSLSKTRFLAFGDSLTTGEVTAPIGFTAAGAIFKQVILPAAAYPTILAKNLRAAYFLQEDAISVANYGMGGEHAANARDRFIQALGVVRPEAVLIMEGTNDIPLGEDGAASSAAREIARMAQEARARGARVFIANLPPGGPCCKAIRPVLLRDYNDRMFVVSRQEGAVFVDVFTALSTNIPRYIGPDGLHPTEAGYAKIAETFEVLIRTEFEVR